MRINKFAGWGRLPPTTTRAPSQLPIAIRELVAPVQRIADVVVRGGPRTPSAAAARVLAVLGMVRDALLDQGCPSRKDFNEQIERARDAKSTKAMQRYLAKLDASLADGFERQFADLDGDGDFERQRRERLAGLIAFEWQVVASVGDDAPTVPAAASA